MSRKFYLAAHPGVTLIEVLIVLGIFTLVIGSIVALLLAGFESKDVVFDQLTGQNEGRKMIQDFTNELRSASVSSIGAYPLAEVSSTEVIFYSNIDQDSLREQVRYFLNGATLKKGVIKPTGNPLTYLPVNEVVTEVVHNVIATSTPLFLYYDQSYAGDASAPLIQPVDVSAVRVVGVQFTLDKDALKSPAPLSLEAKAEIRNLKSN